MRITTRVLIADDHRLMLAALTRALETEAGIQVVGAARRGTAVLPLVRRLRPDVVLLDLHMPDLDGLSCLALIRAEFPELPVLMLTASTDSAAAAAAEAGGARGYVVKSATAAELGAALRGLSPAHAFFSLGAPAAAADELERLTGRERIVLEAVVEGLSNRQIAERLWISEHTVKFHLHAIYRKLDVSTRAAAVRAARRATNSTAA